MTDKGYVIARHYQHDDDDEWGYGWFEKIGVKKGDIIFYPADGADWYTPSLTEAKIFTDLKKAQKRLTEEADEYSDAQLVEVTLEVNL